MRTDLFARPDEERIIYIERLREKWRERGDGDQREQPIGMQLCPALDFINHTRLFSRDFPFGLLSTTGADSFL